MRDFSHFEIDLSYLSKEIGVKDGVSQVELFQESFANKNEEKQFLDFYNRNIIFDESYKFHEVNFSKISFRGKPKMKKTDFISFSPYLAGIKFIINKKVEKILLESCTPKFNKIEVDILLENKVIQNFFLLQFDYVKTKDIDFPNSIIYHGNPKLGKKIVSVNNYSDFLEKTKKHTILNFESIAFRKKEIYDYDMFICQTNQIFISKKLALIFKENKIKGVISGKYSTIVKRENTKGHTPRTPKQIRSL